MAQKILIVNVNWIGDIVFSTPFIKAVREAHPDAHIACLLHPRCVEALESNRLVDEIIIYDEEGSHRSILGKARLVDALKKKGFDSAFLLHRSFTKALIVYASGVPRRVGYATKSRGFLLSEPVKVPEPDTLHKIDYFLELARSAGIPVNDDRYDFFVSEKHREDAKLLLAGFVRNGEPFAVMNPGGNWPPKRWPKEGYARLGDRLVEELGFKVVITGAEKDVVLAKEIASLMKTVPLIICGRTRLGQLGALFERAAVVVANDSGPMHIASAVGAPVVALFGPTAPRLTGPRGRGPVSVLHETAGCPTPCYVLRCADYRCIGSIGVESVLKAVRSIARREGDR